MTDATAARAAVAAALPQGAHVAVAVSGGGDSLALLHLAQGIAAERGVTLWAVTVDHGLRAGAAAEIVLVADYCAARGIPHRVLVWDHGGAIPGNLMAAARAARYGLIADWAAGQGVGHVLLAHTADDQAEGFLMALARGAGLDGLSGMRAGWWQGGVQFLRPLLCVRRQALRDVLQVDGIRWADDPSNTDDRFTRARLRKALAVLEPLGIAAGQIVQAQAHLAASRAALQSALQDWAEAHVTTPAGTVEIDRAAFAALHPEQARRLVLAALAWLTRPDHPPRGADQVRFLTALSEGRAATLAGCRARVTPRQIRLSREPRALADVQTAPDALWDGRWQVTGPFQPGDRLGPVTPAAMSPYPDWRALGLSRDAVLASPALWRDGVPHAVPLLDRQDGWSAAIRGDFRLFILSH